MGEPRLVIPRFRQDWFPTLFGAGVLAALVLLYRVDPDGSSIYPRCPTWTLLGFHCPGCGTLRALHHLLHGDLAGAMARNPLMVLALPFLLHGAWALARQERTGRPLPRWMTSPRAGWILLGVLVGYGVLRNLPFYPFFLLAPP